MNRSSSAPLSKYSKTSKPIWVISAGSNHYVQSSLLPDLTKGWADWKDAPKLQSDGKAISVMGGDGSLSLLNLVKIRHRSLLRCGEWFWFLCLPRKNTQEVSWQLGPAAGVMNFYEGISGNHIK